MSQHDVLASAARALREETARSPRRIPLPRRRDALVATLRGRRAHSRRMTAAAIATLTYLVASGAWATATGRISIAKYVHAIFAGESAPVSRSTAETSPLVRAIPAHHRASHEIAAPAPVAEPAASVSVAPTESTAVTTLQPSREASRPMRSPRQFDPHDDLYRAAHLAQFIQHDPATAVSAWDRYLALAPHGRFAVEAAYNRALSLARLGRYDEARGALVPFARGDHGPYRQREAQQLVERLPTP